MARSRTPCCSNGPARCTATRRRSGRRACWTTNRSRRSSTPRSGAATAPRRRPAVTGEMPAIAMGVHVVDVLARPVEAIPEGQGGALVEEIRITAAGSAGGTALVLAKLGADVRSLGAIGTDAVGDMLLALLERDGVDTSGLLRRTDVQTSASVLPIRPDGSRPAFHVVGANATYGPDDVDWSALEGVTHLHLGGPECMGGEAAGRIAAQARERGITVSADILAPGDSGITDWIAPLFEHLDYLLPNDEQTTGLSGEADLETAARWFVDRGVGCVAATCGGDGVVVVDAQSSERVPGSASTSSTPPGAATH